MKYLIICECSGREKRAREALAVIHPDLEPTLIKGKNAVAKLAAKYDNDHLRSLSKLNGNFSYYVEIDESGKITEEYDLIKGTRVA